MEELELDQYNILVIHTQQKLTQVIPQGNLKKIKHEIHSVFLAGGTDKKY